jgi:hypothetical protein
MSRPYRFGAHFGTIRYEDKEYCLLNQPINKELLQSFDIDEEIYKNATSNWVIENSKLFLLRIENRFQEALIFEKKVFNDSLSTTLFLEISNEIKGKYQFFKFFNLSINEGILIRVEEQTKKIEYIPSYVDS